MTVIPRGCAQPPQIFAAGILSGTFTPGIMTTGESSKCLLEIQASSKETKYTRTLDYAKCWFWNLESQASTNGSSDERCASQMYFMTYEWLKNIFTAERNSVRDFSTPQIPVAGGMADIFKQAVVISPSVLNVYCIS